MILLPPAGVLIKIQIFFFFINIFWLPEKPLDDGRCIRDVLKEMQANLSLTKPLSDSSFYL